MKYILWAVLIVAWAYLLFVLKRSHLHFWHFLCGSVGLFVLMMVFLRPLVTQPLARCVAAVAGIFGDATGTFSAYFKYGILFVNSASGALTLQIDLECSGIIEIMAFVALLTFFEVYSNYEKLLVGISGCVYLLLVNVFRIIIICETIHFGGVSAYYVAHSLIGRIFFYFFTILLYFYVFTRPQILQMKVGEFSYDHAE